MSSESVPTPFKQGISCILLFAAILAPGTASAQEWTQGTPTIGKPAIQETTAAIMGRQDQLNAAGALAKSPPAFRPLRRDDRTRPQWAPARTPTPLLPALNGPEIGPFEPQTVGTNFTGATLADTGAFPPDSMGAIGPTQFIVLINGRLRSFNKSTGVADGVLNVTPDVFFVSVMTPPTNSNFTSDPRIRYDRLSARWILTIIDVPGQAGALPNRVLIAVSDGGTITASTVWRFFFFQHDLVAPVGDTGQFADYPTLGVDAQALYIGVNVFDTTLGTFVNTTAFVVRKQFHSRRRPNRGHCLSRPHQRLGRAVHAQGVDSHDPLATEGYVLGVDDAFLGRLALRRISNPGGTPAISTNVFITTDPTSQPIRVRHLGGTNGASGRLSAVDFRLFNAHLRNGRLWTAHNIGVDNTGAAVTSGATRNGCRWYELQGIPTGQTPSVVQSGTLSTLTANNLTSERNYWIPSIMVSGQGHVALGFSTAGTNERANAGTAGRLATDPPGTLRAPTLYTNSTTAYNPPGDPGGPEGRRWGDFSYTSLDPCDDMTMWTIQEFCNATNSYGVAVAKLIAPPPATPASASPSLLPQSLASVNVIITGTQIDGSGFYDPGPGFNCHIGAAATGGIIVNSVTYTNPTHVVLNISTVSAATGPQSVTILNPDGQPAASIAGLLTITPPIPADFDHDGFVDQADYAVFAGCFSGPTVPAIAGCAAADFDGDSDVDLSDFGAFQKCFSGSAQLASFNCTQ